RVPEGLVQLVSNITSPSCSVPMLGTPRPSRLRRCLPRKAGSLDPTCARCGAMGPSHRGLTHTEFAMTLKIYPIVLQLVRRLSPYLPALRARSTALGDQLERALISIPLNLAEGA